MKISLVIPERIKGAILLNPGCFRFVSMGFKNLYHNLLPLFKPNKTNIEKFLNEIIFNKPVQQISNAAESHLIDYLELAINDYKDNTEKPYYMRSQLDNVRVKTHLIVGDQDLLLPYKKSVSNAKKHLKENLKSVQVEKSAHGIEIYKKAINHIHQIIEHSIS